MSWRLDRQNRWLLLASCRWFDDFDLRYAAAAWSTEDRHKLSLLHRAVSALAGARAVSIVGQAVGSSGPTLSTYAPPQHNELSRWLNEAGRYVVPGAEAESIMVAAVSGRWDLVPANSKLDIDVDALCSDLEDDLAALKSAASSDISDAQMQQLQGVRRSGLLEAVFLQPMIVLCSALTGGCDYSQSRSVAEAFARLSSDETGWDESLARLFSLI